MSHNYAYYDMTRAFIEEHRSTEFVCGITWILLTCEQKYGSTNRT